MAKRAAAAVYCAGKIAKNDWRHTLFPGLRGAGPDDWLERDGLVYTGPWFVSCDHGCAHGPHTHGTGPACGEDDDPVTVWNRRQMTLLQGRAGLLRADVVFAWIDAPTAFGTFVELGYALGRGKGVFVAFPGFRTDSLKKLTPFTPTRAWVRDLWWLCHAVHEAIEAPTVEAAWERFVAWLDGTWATADALARARRPGLGAGFALNNWPWEDDPA
ncbi:MAG: nucleoside 2-deoxyribosyltransferase domain-containing protein [Actinomycetia bacterium]|nr:nucleoside 2-deoxyribosyltransferase domain-containing protein [Actinomycetes bacterium]